MEKVIKYNRPTKFDHAPYGQIWLVELEESQEQWIQLGKDENVGQWSMLGYFLEKHATLEDIERYLHEVD
jgi:hypothetical protein